MKVSLSVFTRTLLLGNALLCFAIAGAHAQVINSTRGCEACKELATELNKPLDRIWASYTNILVRKGLQAREHEPPCYNPAEIKKKLEEIFKSYMQNIISANAAGAVIDWLPMAGEMNRERIHEMFHMGHPNAANCVPICVAVPQSADVLRIRGQMRNATPEDYPVAQNSGIYLGCGGNEGGFCHALEWSSWRNLHRVEGNRMVCGTAANWSHNLDRVGRLNVYFEMPAGQKPEEPE